MKSRRLPWRSGAMLVLLLLLGMAAWFLASSRLTRTLEQRLAAVVGGEVRIAGGLEPIWWARPGIALRELQVSGRSGAPHEVHAERLEIRFATGNPAGLIVSTGMKLYGEETGSSKLEGRAKATAKEIADQLKPRFQEQGWIE